MYFILTVLVWLFIGAIVFNAVGILLIHAVPSWRRIDREFQEKKAREARIRAELRRRIEQEIE